MVAQPAVTPDSLEWEPGEVLPITEGFLASIENILKDNAEILDTVGGNLMIHIQDLATWTIVTRGPRMGIYYTATDDPIDCALFTEEWALLELIDPDCDVDLSELVEEGYVTLTGDFSLFERLMNLGQGQSALSLMTMGMAQAS